MREYEIPLFFLGITAISALISFAIVNAIPICVVSVLSIAGYVYIRCYEK